MGVPPELSKSFDHDLVLKSMVTFLVMSYDLKETYLVLGVSSYIQYTYIYLYIYISPILVGFSIIKPFWGSPSVGSPPTWLSGAPVRHSR